MMGSDSAPASRPAALVVIEPNGHRWRAQVDPVPFKIGRQADNHLIIRDSRASRNHARIVAENGELVLHDQGSRHGTYVNGERIERRQLHESDKIEFGFPDSYQLIFTREDPELSRLIEQFPAHESRTSIPGAGANLAKLRAVLDVARTLQSSFSMQDVLNAVVDAALAVTGAERGFLLLRREADLETRVARDNHGRPLAPSELRVPRQVIQRALQQRRDLLFMNFDPVAAGSLQPEHSVADLELRSVICVPLVRVSMRVGDDTNIVAKPSDTVGVLYMDSRLVTADLAGGNRELLQTLAIEASTILENARLLDEERSKQKLEEELSVARTIQQSLLPRQLPSTGWFRACGSSVASHQVGGDYFDVFAIRGDCYGAVVADVSGKGVSSALLASLLQGAFLTVSDRISDVPVHLVRINQYLQERTEGEKYATIFYSMLERSGSFQYINAGHCAPILVRSDGSTEYLGPTSMPVGLTPGADFGTESRQLAPADKVVNYSDGVTEAQSPSGEFFGRKRLREITGRHGASSCQQLHADAQAAISEFTRGAAQSDDMTLLVVEFQP
jgi:serine phosphatase RsbU (regulator of sigma subunit)